MSEIDHGADWSDHDIDHPEEPPSCKCGYNGTPEECAASRYGYRERGGKMWATCSLDPIRRLEEDHLPVMDRLGGSWNHVARDVREAIAALRVTEGAAMSVSTRPEATFTWECSQCGETGVFGDDLWMPSHATRHVKSAFDVVPKLIVRMEES